MSLYCLIFRFWRVLRRIQGSFFFALSESYYLSYDETSGTSHKIVEKSVTLGIDCGT
jgi:hypothetical protein